MGNLVLLCVQLILLFNIGIIVCTIALAVQRVGEKKIEQEKHKEYKNY